MVASDTQIAGSPPSTAPSPAQRSPELGLEVGDRHRRLSSSPGKLAGGSAKETRGQSIPKTPSQPGQRTQGPGSCSSWEAGGGCSSFLPDASPRTVHLRGSGAGWGRHPPNHTQKQAKAWACAPPQPRSPDKGAKGEVRGAAGVKITDPFIKGKKAKIQKKKEKS